VAAFRRWPLRPRVLVDVGAVTTRTGVLGRPVSMPVLVAPTAYQRLAHPEGELAMARGAAAAGTIHRQSSLSSVRPPRSSQRVSRKPTAASSSTGRTTASFTRDLVAEAVESGCTALVLTVDVPLAGRRERDLRTAFQLPADLPMPNVSPRVERPTAGIALGQIVDLTLTWRDLEWLAGVSTLPLVIKGILTAEDALLACERGAAAVSVSNHGGRARPRAPGRAVSGRRSARPRRLRRTVIRVAQ
jgi:4-hydroxymandelate oxidase